MVVWLWCAVSTLGVWLDRVKSFSKLIAGEGMSLLDNSIATLLD